MNTPRYNCIAFSEVTGTRVMLYVSLLLQIFLCLIVCHWLSLGGTEQAYSFVDFNRDGSLLASVGSAPDYMLTLWNWRQEEVMLCCKAISQEVYRVSFSPYNPRLLTSSGPGHIK